MTWQRLNVTHNETIDSFRKLGCWWLSAKFCCRCRNYFLLKPGRSVYHAIKYEIRYEIEIKANLNDYLSCFCLPFNALSWIMIFTPLMSLLLLILEYQSIELENKVNLNSSLMECSIVSTWIHSFQRLFLCYICNIILRWAFSKQPAVIYTHTYLHPNRNPC